MKVKKIVIVAKKNSEKLHNHSFSKQFACALVGTFNSRIKLIHVVREMIKSFVLPGFTKLLEHCVFVRLKQIN